MTRDQIKKIVKLTESIVNKKLNESMIKNYDSFPKYDTKDYKKAVDYIANNGDVNARQLAKYLNLTVFEANQILSDIKQNESVSHVLNKKLNESGAGEPASYNYDRLEKVYVEINNITFKIKDNYEVKSKLLQIEKLLKDCLTLLN